MSFSMIVAHDINRVIGYKGKIPWDLPYEMQMFTSLTDGATVIMGRKTWDSLKTKPLPGRRNVVLSRTMGFRTFGVTVCRSVKEIVHKYSHMSKNDLNRPMIIGGAEMYEQFLPYVDHMWISIINEKFEGDVKFPSISMEDWKFFRYQIFEKDENNKHEFHLFAVSRNKEGIGG